ncbi:GumC family protein [Pararhodonellum marinum]|uniref:GumC family protein n=1 Tax=Pararhodonellum marinum TaxID=2755358 RepID=UPI00188F3C27|nr:tyrosine-protein kinase family protein [Pararhodonellum marinum]
MDQKQPIQTQTSGRVGEDELYWVKEIVIKYLRNWPWILLSIFLFMTGAYLITRYTQPVYRSYSQFFIKEYESGMNLFDQRWFSNSEMELTNQIIILKSRPVAELAINKLNFEVEYHIEGIFTKIERYPTAPILVQVDWEHPQLVSGEFEIKWDNKSQFSLAFPEERYRMTQLGDEGARNIEKPILDQNVFSFGQWVSLPFMRIKVNHTSSDVSGKILVKLRDKSSLISQYASSLQVRPVDKMSTILELGINTNLASKGRDYLNALMQAYIENELEQKNQTATNTVKFIDDQLEGLSDTLNFIENRLEAFRSTNRIYDISSEGSEVFQRLSGLDRELAQEELKREYYRNLSNYLVKEDYNEIIIPSGLGIDDPILNGLIQNLLELQNKKSSLMVTQKEASPAVREVNRELQDLNNSIRELLVNVDENAAFLIRDLEMRIGQIDLEFSRLPAKEQNLLRIQRDYAFSENIYTFLLQKRAESAIMKASNSPSNKIIEYARSSGGPISPKPNFNYSIALSLGMLLPLLFVLSKVYLSDKIKDVKDLEKRLLIPIMASIAFKKINSNLAVFLEKQSGVAEAFRSLRSNMNFVLPKDKTSVILITSNSSGEGKTFCSINLASVYSLSGKKTLLVGTDLRRPKIYQDFEMKNDMGLSNYLSGQEEDFQKLIKPTTFENLDVLLAGPIPPNPAELLSNERMELLLTELRGYYDVIVLDTPPVGLVSETLELIAMADVTFFVVRYNYTTRPAIDHINHLKNNQLIKNAFVIFNSVDEKEMNYGYAYGYSYGYGYYSDDEVKKPWWRKVLNR